MVKSSIQQTNMTRTLLNILVIVCWRHSCIKFFIFILFIDCSSCCRMPQNKKICWLLHIFHRFIFIAQITQWDLIFYGTEIPAQPNDSQRNRKPNYDDTSYGGEIEHNSLEFETNGASDQWRNLQQVRFK